MATECLEYDRIWFTFFEEGNNRGNIIIGELSGNRRGRNALTPPLKSLTRKE